MTAPASPPETGASMKLGPALRHRHGELARDLGRGGRVVDEHGALAETRQDAVVAIGDGAQIGVVPHHREDDLRPRRRLARRPRHGAAMLGAPRLGLARAAIVHGHLMALGGQMPGHRQAHHPQADERGLCHSFLLELFGSPQRAAGKLQASGGNGTRRGGLPATGPPATRAGLVLRCTGEERATHERARHHPLRDNFYGWTREQARALRASAAASRVDLPAPVDFANLAEEIESLGISQLRELYSRYRVLLAHLLKWQHQPDHRTPSWRTTIRTQRDEIAKALRLSPGLKLKRQAELDEAYAGAREDAADDGARVPAVSERCPYALDEVEDRAFWP